MTTETLTTAALPDVDPAAPWGRKADGTPKAKPGRPRKNASGPAPAAPPRKRTTRTRKPAQPDYRPGLRGLVAVPVTVLTTAGLAGRRPALMADAATLALNAETLVDGIHQLAMEEPQVAAVLDWLTRVGPYSQLATAVIGIGAQIAVNHGKLKPGIMGTKPPEELAAMLAQDQGQAAPTAAQDQGQAAPTAA